jgi:hypothetical protein
MTSNPNISTLTEQYLFELVEDIQHYQSQPLKVTPKQVQTLTKFMREMADTIESDYEVFVTNLNKDM